MPKIPWRRIGAYTVDILPLTLIVVAIAYFFFGFDEVVKPYLADRHDLDAKRRFLEQRNRVRDSVFVVWLLYSAAFDASTLQGTPGKYLLDLRVVDRVGARLTPGRAAARNALKLLSRLPCFLGFLWAVFSKQQRTWHDILSSTSVVRRDGLEEAARTLPEVGG